MKRPVALRVRDALDVMAQAEAFVGALRPDEFSGDAKTVFAVERCFTVLGEALRHVPDDIRAAHSDVPWRDIVGMRNRIAHDYLYTDLDLVWQTVRIDFPALRPALERLLAELDAETPDEP